MATKVAGTAGKSPWGRRFFFDGVNQPGFEIEKFEFKRGKKPIPQGNTSQRKQERERDKLVFLMGFEANHVFKGHS